MTTAFVAGATGFTGREVVRVLVEQGLRTVAHVRPDSSRLDDWRERFAALGAEVDSTPWEGDALRATFERLRPDQLYALIGTTVTRLKEARREGHGDTFERVDFELRKLLVDALVEAAIPARFVELSTVGVGPRSPSSYLRIRWKTEEYIRASGLPHTIVRPGFIVGPGRDDRRPVEYAAATLLNGTARVLQTLGMRRVGARYRSITNVDLAAALVRLALDDAAEGQVVEGRGLIS